VRYTPSRSVAPVERPARWRRTIGTALAATLAVAVGVGAWSARPVTVSAPAGAQYTLSLPDGSQVELNAGSSLTYAGGFRSRLGLPAAVRAVRLDGEAFFDVAHAADRPFEVLTDAARVTVLGTRFLVRAHADEPDGTRVAVESGRVRVAARTAEGPAGAVELTAGQGTRIARDGTAPAVAEVGVERLTLWRRGGLAFVDQPLSAIVRELERRYAVEIRLQDAGVTDERITYYAGQPSIETVLSDLCTPRGLRFTRTSRGFEITAVLEAGAGTP
ncbi:MAG TPA: FecR domain-containing protein, partial [Gemmatimonadaceae bacterium]|nr:FecR domain-containing protein [Gemmatimonadaceae bacterium]